MAALSIALSIIREELRHALPAGDPVLSLIEVVLVKAERRVRQDLGGQRYHLNRGSTSERRNKAVWIEAVAALPSAMPAAEVAKRIGISERYVRQIRDLLGEPGDSGAAAEHLCPSVLQGGALTVAACPRSAPTSTYPPPPSPATASPPSPAIPAIRPALAAAQPSS